MSAEALIRSMLSGRLAAARAARSGEADRRAKLMAERAAIEPFRPTPNQQENDRTARNPADICAAEIVGPVAAATIVRHEPVNTTPPSIIPFDTLEVGHQLAGQVGAGPVPRPTAAMAP